MAAIDIIENERPSLLFLLIDAVAYLVRRGGLFLLIAVPIAGAAAGLTWALDTQYRLLDWRGHWGWDFMFVLVYAMFLDRWIKESLLDGTADYDEVDNLRRSIVAPRFLVFVAALFVLATVLFTMPIASHGSPVQRFHFGGAALANALAWAPHFVLWGVTLACLALYLPALSAAEPLSLRQALRLGRAVRPILVMLVLGAALLSLLGAAAADWAPQHLPHRPWVLPALTAAHRLFDCLLLAVVGHMLAGLFRQGMDWRTPEPVDNPYRTLRLARRKVPRL
jgi:hypothetical protein